MVHFSSSDSIVWCPFWTPGVLFLLSHEELVKEFVYPCQAFAILKPALNATLGDLPVWCLFVRDLMQHWLFANSLHYRFHDLFKELDGLPSHQQHGRLCSLGLDIAV
jgi:hypothetical protein